MACADSRVTYTVPSGATTRFSGFWPCAGLKLATTRSPATDLGAACARLAGKASASSATQATTIAGRMIRT